MKHAAWSFALGLLAASCGGKAAPAGGGGPTTEAPAGAIAPGIHGCAFTHEGVTYGPHRCDVVDGSPQRLDKLSGMELFSGTITESADGHTIAAKGACGEMGTACDLPFTIELSRDGASWRGPVTADGSSDWWLAGSTFELSDAADYGGEGYGGAGYGGSGE